MKLYYVEDLGHRYIVSAEKLDKFLQELDVACYSENKQPKIKEIFLTDWAEL